MRICLVIGRTPRRWHHWLAARLLADGAHHVTLSIQDVPDELPRVLWSLMALECLVYGVAEDCAIDRLPIADGSLAALERQVEATDEFDLIISAVGSERLPKTKRALIPLVNGDTVERGALNAALGGSELHLEVFQHRGSTLTSDVYRVAAERPIILNKLFNGVCARVCYLVQLCVEGKPLPQSSIEKSCHNPDAYSATSSRAIAHSTAALTLRLYRRLQTIAEGGDRWHVGWRRGETPLQIGGRNQTLRFTRLPDDGQRYFADPFPLRHRGQEFLFCEEFPYATGKGIIAVAALDGSDPPVIIPIIEEDYHLSYPMIFQDEGTLWMIPEAGACGNLVLYRCIGFPTKWERAAILVSDLVVYDPTIHRDRSGYWLFFTTAEPHKSPSERLEIFHAQRLFGPWHRVGQGSILIDPMTARPAGHLVPIQGKLYRPVQNCIRTYGGDVLFCEILELAPGTFQQQPVGRLAAFDCRSFRGAHTYNRYERLEASDVFGIPTQNVFDLSYTALSTPKSHRASPVEERVLSL